MDKKSEKDDKILSKKEMLRRLGSIPPMGIRTNASPEISQAIQGTADTMAKNGFNRSASAGLGYNSSNVARGPLMYVDPMFDPILFLFPKDRIDEINKRLRHYYETDPIVGGAIDMHSAFPLSDFSLECDDPENQTYWNDWKERVGLLETLRCLVHDYWLLGEGVALPVWDSFNFEISHFNQYPPENVDILQTYVTPKKMFMLKPDAKLMEKIKSGNKADQALLQMMDGEYVKSLEEGRPFFLGTDDKVMYLARQTSKYRARGISLLSRALKDLLYKDKLRLLQLTFVDRHMFPLKVFKVGSESKGWIPNKAHFQKLQGLLAQAQNDPDFNLLWHFGLTIDYVGTKDKIANLTPEFEWVEKQVMAALFVNEEIIHGGLPSAVRDTVNMRTLMLRYMDVREKIERMMITHIFLPMARARGFYRKGGEAKAKKMEERFIKVAGKNHKVKFSSFESNEMFRIANTHSGTLDLSAFDIPRPMWKKINLVNNASEQQLIMNLESEGKVPLETVLDMLGLDARAIKSKLKAQESTVFDPLYRDVRNDLGRSEGVREQVLAGTKVEKWSQPESIEEELAVGGPAMPGGPKKGPAAPPGGGGAPPKPKAPEKPKVPGVAPGAAPGAPAGAPAGAPGGMATGPKPPAPFPGAMAPAPAMPALPPLPAPISGGEGAPGMGGGAK
jgi:hypothetical protein